MHVMHCMRANAGVRLLPCMKLVSEVMLCLSVGDDFAWKVQLSHCLLGLICADHKLLLEQRSGASNQADHPLHYFCFRPTQWVAHGLNAVAAHCAEAARLSAAQSRLNQNFERFILGRSHAQCNRFDSTERQTDPLSLLCPLGR